LKSIIYKNPVKSGIILNLFSMCLSIYAIKYSVSLLSIAIVSVGILNRKIIDNGVCLDKKKKMIIMVSFIIMISVFFIYSQYFHYIINKQLENI